MYAVDWVVFVFYAHYFAVVGNGCNDEFAWHGFVNNCQGVVASHLELFRYIFKDLDGCTCFATLCLPCITCLA